MHPAVKWEKNREILNEEWVTINRDKFLKFLYARVHLEPHILLVSWFGKANYLAFMNWKKRKKENHLIAEKYCQHQLIL